MKRGFTMIELIFVIVILGILAAVAIPRLAATRDDAEVSKAATNVATAVSDLSSYYTAQGLLPEEAGKKLGDLTNVVLTENSARKVSLMKVKKVDCFAFALRKAEAAEADPTKNIEEGTPVLVVTGEGVTLDKAQGTATAFNSDSACKGAQQSVLKILLSSPIRLGGTGINFEGTLPPAKP